jgi:hypothetical protein
MVTDEKIHKKILTIHHKIFFIFYYFRISFKYFHCQVPQKMSNFKITSKNSYDSYGLNFFNHLIQGRKTIYVNLGKKKQSRKHRTD